MLKVLSDAAELIARALDVRAVRDLSRPPVSDSTRPSVSLQPVPCRPSPFPDLTLVRILGQGSYGRVFLGRLNNPANHTEDAVAVKVLMDCGGLPIGQAVPKECMLIQKIQHPNLCSVRSVRCVMDKQRCQLTQEDDGCQTPKQKQHEWWLVMPYCNEGTVLEAFIRGRFGLLAKSQRSFLSAFLTVAEDVALGMAALHDEDIVHGDLKSGNVLLCTDTTRSTGIWAQVADFGVAQVILSGSKVSMSSCGTVAYQAPETLREGTLSKAGDVYAYGVLLWEMIMGEVAWAGLRPAQIIVAVSIRKERLPTVCEGPAFVKLTIEACTASDHKRRPSFADLCLLLDIMRRKQAASIDLDGYI